ncbi:MAG: N-6 DNA methylase [Bacteroidetes bacterium]|nr:N-6 DNA methylase [Bacteroidota bacterium]
MAKSELDKWLEAQEYQVALDGQGKIIDYLDPETKRENKPEERIRQKTAHILHRELGYPKELIGFERTINIGRERKRADIIVYENKRANAENEQGKIILVGEIKAPNIKSQDGQLVSYISACSAQGGFWTNGGNIEFYRKDNKKNEILNWLGVPKYGLAWDSIGKFSKSDLISPVDLKLAFQRCHNAIYRSGIDSEDVALDMVRVILAKIEDESSAADKCEFHITPDEFHTEKLRKVACLRVRNLFDAVKDRYPDVFNKHEEITASDSQLAIVVSYLQQYSFLDAPYDVIGTAYEVYVASHLKGERGQFFTNRLVVDMMVKIIDPTEKDLILDPACGSGGFLVSSMNYLFKKIDSSKRTVSAKEILKRNLVHQIYGSDISPKLTKIAKANMLIGKDGHGGIEQANSLDDISKFSANFQDKAGIGKATIILTNPPFGSGHDIRIKEGKILGQYKSGMVWNINEKNEIIYENRTNSKQGVAPEILFLEKSIQWLKPGGKLGIVMAKGQLDNREAIAIRRYILANTRILGVVNLHEDTFQPFCGSKASVIFIEKPAERLPKDYKIFLAISNKVGQTSRGEAIFKRDSEGSPIIKKGSYILDEDLTDIALDYHKFLEGNLTESAFRFSIKLSELDKSDYSLNPIRYLPKHNAAFQKVLALGDNEEFEIHRLGDITRVYNGPRFKRPYAELGITEGPTIRKYFTGTAITQLNTENIKYLDSSKADKQTKKHLEALTIYHGYILVSDSGTLGRVAYALKQHNGHIATNNLIRIVVDNLFLRGYIYQFLKSEIGQSLMLKSAYGTNQEHLEPDVIAEIPIPVPKNKSLIKKIGQNVINSIEELEKSLESTREAESQLNTLFG